MARSADSGAPLAGEPASANPLSARTIVVGGLLVALTAVVLLAVLLLLYGSGSPTDQAKLDAVRTAGAIVIGTGGAAALLLTARRQRWAELTLEHQQRVAAITKAHQERVSAATELDAAERRITELYARAADQLGSDKAPVRLAGLYALERLATGTPSQRQTIVSVISAYLRMPYDPGESGSIPPGQDERMGWVAEELQVRLTAQRILASHLRPDPPTSAGIDTRYWRDSSSGDLDVDLTGAGLVDLDFTGCRMRTAHFEGARFSGPARFDDVEILGQAVFDRARFSDGVFFNRAMFGGETSFKSAEFGEPPPLEAAFTGDPGFSDATFCSDAIFSGQPVFGYWFKGAKFRSVFYPPADVPEPQPSPDGEWRVVPWSDPRGSVISVIAEPNLDFARDQQTGGGLV